MCTSGGGDDIGAGGDDCSEVNKKSSGPAPGEAGEQAAHPESLSMTMPSVHL